jgi:hypothetical protein
MTSNTASRADAEPTEVWQRFKAGRAQILGEWVEAERALALAKRNGTANGATGDRLLAAEAALQGAIVDFATGERPGGDPLPVALALLRLAESELFPVPPDLRSAGHGDRRRSDRGQTGGGDRRAQT